jgi:selenocysteine lyase/cysteine desulfurase
MESIACHERALADRLRGGLAGIDGVALLRLWPGADVDRVGVATFTHREHRHPLLAAALSEEHAIGVRHGCFCAHPLITHLLGVTGGEIDRLRAELVAGGRPRLPGAVRASLGLGTTPADIEALVEALGDIARHGPRASYRYAAEFDEYHARGS